MKDSQINQLTRFALETGFNDIPGKTVDQLKKHLLDSIGSFIYAAERPTIRKLIRQIQVLSVDKGTGFSLAKTSLDRIAELYTALIRYPDFMDNFIGKEATCHPSDHIGALLAVSSHLNLGGRDFLAAMAIGYDIECRLVEEIPVMVKGFDHTVLLGYSLTAAISRLLKLSSGQTANALGITGCSNNPLVTCRASYTYEWKGLASAFVAQNCVNIALLAKEGITGPIDLFDGPKGFHEIYGMALKHDWGKEDFSLIEKCVLKSYNAEVHTQSAIEAVLELREKYTPIAEEIMSIDLTTFLTAFHIVGGGAYGDRHSVFSKEQADHSLPYLVAVALLDGKVYPEQLLKERIHGEDVQQLLKKVEVHTGLPFHKPVQIAGMLDPKTIAYPEKLMTDVSITLKDGVKLRSSREDYNGFYTRPFSWEDTENKFSRLTAGLIDGNTQQHITDLCRNLENEDVSSLTEILNAIIH